MVYSSRGGFPGTKKTAGFRKEALGAFDGSSGSAVGRPPHTTRWWPPGVRFDRCRSAQRH